MGTRDPRVDRYIAAAPEHARPVLTRLRAVVHRACPEVTETIKWRNAAFEYHGLLAGMAAFKKHCAFGFWKTALLKDWAKTQGVGDDVAKAVELGNLYSVDDLPPDRALVAAVRAAAKLNADGVKAPPRAKKKHPPLRLPTDFRAALSASKPASARFDAFSPSKKREYVEWIIDAKGADTRARRIATAVDWIAQGKSRNWKYENC